MGQYSIKELEKLSGIKAHTIRIWEKRYNLISPSRTATNIRFYSDSDLRKIINVAAVNNAGVKISHISRYTDSELGKMIQQAGKSIEIAPIDQLVVAMVEMNEPAFEKVFSKLSGKTSFEEVIVNVVYPFLEKIGILWQTGNITPAQEHFMTNLIRQKLFVAIDGLPFPGTQAPSAVLFLPENEYHEMGLLFYHYLCRQEGVRSVYLGQSVPYSDLKSVVEVHQPKFIITSLTTSQDTKKLKAFLQTLSADFRKQTILISGRAMQGLDLKKYPNMGHFNNAIGLKSLLDK